jgi:hypothetical protein
VMPFGATAAVVVAAVGWLIAVTPYVDVPIATMPATMASRVGLFSKRRIAVIARPPVFSAFEWERPRA